MTMLSMLVVAQATVTCPIVMKAPFETFQYAFTAKNCIGCGAFPATEAVRQMFTGELCEAGDSSPACRHFESKHCICRTAGSDEPVLAHIGADYGHGADRKACGVDSCAAMHQDMQERNPDMQFQKFMPDHVDGDEMRLRCDDCEKNGNCGGMPALGLKQAAKGERGRVWVQSDDADADDDVQVKSVASKYEAARNQEREDAKAKPELVRTASGGVVRAAARAIDDTTDVSNEVDIRRVAPDGEVDSIDSGAALQECNSEVASLRKQLKEAQWKLKLKQGGD